MNDPCPTCSGTGVLPPDGLAPGDPGEGRTWAECPRCTLWGYRVGDPVWLSLGVHYFGPGTVHRIHHDHPPCVLVELKADPDRKPGQATHLYAHEASQLRHDPDHTA